MLRNVKMRKSWLLILLIALLFVIVGCSTGDETTTGGGESLEENTEESSGEDLEESTEEIAESKDITIGVSMPDVRGPFFSALRFGIEQRAEEMGVELIYLDAGGYENIPQQVSQMEDLISRGVDGILLDPADTEALSPMVDLAVEAGIPVVGSGVSIDNPNVSSSVTVENTELGKAMANWIVEALDGEGQIAIVAGPPGAQWTTDRFKGLEEVLAEHPGIEILDVKWDEPDRATSLKIAEDYLTQYPEIDLIYAADDIIGQGVGDAVETAGRKGKTKIITAILGEDTETMIREGLISATVAVELVTNGHLAIDTILKVIEGQEVEELIEISTQTITIENIDDVDFSKIRQPEGWRPGT